MAADDIEAALLKLLGESANNADGVDLRARVREMATSAVRKFGETRAHPPTGYFPTDMGNAERLLDAHGADLRFVQESKRWLRWNGCRFVEDRKRYTERLMYTLMRKMYLEAVNMPHGEARDAALGGQKSPRAATRLLRLSR